MEMACNYTSLDNNWNRVWIEYEPFNAHKIQNIKTVNAETFGGKWEVVSESYVSLLQVSLFHIGAQKHILAL